MGDMNKDRRLLDAYTLFYYGDALGYPVEFMTARAIQNLNSNDRVSDDSQLMFLCMESQVRDKKHDYLKSWLKLMEDPINVRAPGGVCLFAAEKGYPIKDSKGSGALMRVPSFFWRSNNNLPDILSLVQADTKKTHIDENTVAASTFYYLWVDALMHNHDWKFNPVEINKRLSSYGFKPFNFPEFFVDNDVWIAEEILKFLFDAVLNLPTNPEDFMEQVVRIDGDSDTVGSLAGFLIPFLYEEAEYMEIIKNIQGEVVEYRNKTKTLLMEE